MSLSVVMTMAFYTLILVGGIYYYEDKIKSIDLDRELFEDAYNSEHNSIHVQLEINDELVKENLKLKQQLAVAKSRRSNKDPAQYKDTELNVEL